MKLDAPQGRFQLDRYPIRPKETLRAWDAADELLLSHVDGLGLGADARVLIVNDSFGALSTALADHRPVMATDSFLAQCATEQNLRNNGVPTSQVELLSSLDPLPEQLDLVLVRIPKGLALLEDQLRRISAVVGPDTIVVAAAMAKHIHTSTLESFERLLGPTTTSLATKKARLVFCTPDPTIDAGPDPWPHRFAIEPGHQVIINHPAVFSSQRLDIGTSFLLSNLPDTSGPERVVDLGCGNGVVGLVAALDNPEAEITFVDESYMAVASAEATFHENLGDDRPARFVVGDGLDRLSTDPEIADGSIDLVLNNPPFHTNHALGDATAWQMFSESRRALRVGGELWVVGNRHLAYHAKLKRIFGNCDVVASNAKFVVYRSVRR